MIAFPDLVWPVLTPGRLLAAVALLSFGLAMVRPGGDVALVLAAGLMALSLPFQRLPDAGQGIAAATALVALAAMLRARGPAALPLALATLAIGAAAAVAMAQGGRSINPWSGAVAIATTGIAFALWPRLGPLCVPLICLGAAFGATDPSITLALCGVGLIAMLVALRRPTNAKDPR